MESTQEKTNNAGITLIALVITIIVMLILAGVSLNATIGENGIISKAQDALTSNAVASMNEYMQQWYFNQLQMDETFGIEKFYVNSNFIERKLSVDESGNAYYVYIINKSNIPEDNEILTIMHGGDGDPFLLEDVYGINPDFSIWYKNDKGEFINSEIQVAPIDSNTTVNFKDQTLASAVLKAAGSDLNTNQMTIGVLTNVTKLTLNENNTEPNIKNLDDLYYLPNLNQLTVYYLNLENLNGLKYASNIKTINFSKCQLNDMSALKYCTQLMNLNITGDPVDGNILGITNNNIVDFFNAICDIPTITSLTISNGNNSLTDISSFNSGIQKSKFKSKIINFSIASNRFSGILDLTGCSAIRTLYINSNYGISEVRGLENMNLTYLNAENNSLTNISNLNMDLSTSVNTTVNLRGNPEISQESIIAISSILTSVKSYTIDLNLAQYIEGNKVLDYRTVILYDGDVTNIPDSVETIYLNSQGRLTNIDFLMHKQNIKTLYLNSCTGLEQEDFNTVLSTLTGIKYLNLQSNSNLIDISFIKNMPNLKDLTISNTNVEFMSSDSPNVEALNSTHLDILNIGCTTSKYTGNNIDLTLIQTCISNMNIDNNGIRFEGNAESKTALFQQIENCTEITNLNMRYWNSEINKLNLSKCTKLEYVSLVQLGCDVDISNCVNLKQIRISSLKTNEYSKISDLSKLINLERIYFTSNFMTNSDFYNMCEDLSNATNLQKIDVSGNSISTLNGISFLAGLTNFKVLQINRNNLSDISKISDLKNLTELQVRYNNLDNSSVTILANHVKTYRKMFNIYIYGNPKITNLTELSEINGINKSYLSQV